MGALSALLFALISANTYGCGIFVPMKLCCIGRCMCFFVRCVAWPASSRPLLSPAAPDGVARPQPLGVLGGAGLSNSFAMLFATGFGDRRQATSDRLSRTAWTAKCKGDRAEFSKREDELEHPWAVRCRRSCTSPCKAPRFRKALRRSNGSSGKGNGYGLDIRPCLPQVACAMRYVECVYLRLYMSDCTRVDAALKKLPRRKRLVFRRSPLWCSSETNAFVCKAGYAYIG